MTRETSTGSDIQEKPASNEPVSFLNRRVTGSTGLVGLIGWPVHHSLSPQMHNAAFAALDLDFVYLPLPVHPESLEPALLGAAALGFRGVNVTVPHKQAVMAFLDEIDPAAQAIGAVNTIRFDPATGSVSGADRGASILRGYNTDWSGFQADLHRHGVSVRAQDCLVLGAGGSARAVVYALAQAGARVHVYARRLEQAISLIAALAPYALVAALSPHDWLDLHSIPFEPALIVNTTPVGMYPQVDASPWPAGCTWPGKPFVYDLVYNPSVSRFMREAQQAGLRATNGVGMLLWQGAQAFAIWTGQQPDLAAMQAALEFTLLA